LSVIGLGVLLYAAGDSGSNNGPSVGANQALEGAALKSLLPEKLGGLERADITAWDATGLTMLGAIDGQVGSYAGDMNLLLLRYRSPELAANAIQPVRTALFPDTDGWEVAPERESDPAHRLTAAQSETDMMVSVWNYGSLVLIFWGDAAQMPKFALPAEVLARATR
jgi:hypothetical protein